MKKIQVHTISFLGKSLYWIKIPHIHNYLIKFSTKYSHVSIHLDDHAERKLR